MNKCNHIFDEYGLCFECDKEKGVTAANRAKELGAVSLKQVADEWGTTTEALRHHFHNNPHKFDIIAAGVVEMEKKRKRDEFEKTL